MFTYCHNRFLNSDTLKILIFSTSGHTVRGWDNTKNFELMTLKIHKKKLPMDSHPVGGIGKSMQKSVRWHHPRSMKTGV